MASELAILISDLKENEAVAWTRKTLEAGKDPMEVMAAAREGMKIVGERFAEGDYFIPDLIFSGKILKAVAELAEPYLKESKAGASEKVGKVVLGTVEGDIHDIGKDMVAFMLDISGYEVIDLGIDVPKQKFVDAIKESGSKVVGMSGFLTLAFDAMKQTVEAIKEAGLRDHVKIMVGGGQIDQQVMTFTGADAYGQDAMEAVKLANQWYGG
ncbi:MAG: cobalamin-dependent protein [Pseudomonadota bacterium]